MLGNGGSPANDRPILFLIHGVIRKPGGSSAQPAAAESGQNLCQRGHRDRTMRRTCRFKTDRRPEPSRPRSASSPAQCILSRPRCSRSLRARNSCSMMSPSRAVTVSGPSSVHFETGTPPGRHLTGAAREHARRITLGRLDSNQRMAESKSAALPLGYAPLRGVVASRRPRAFHRRTWRRHRDKHEGFSRS